MPADFAAERHAQESPLRMLSPKTHLTNEELLKNYQQADADSFREFFERNHRLLFNYFLSRLGSRADADEALQRTFLRLHKYILSYDPERSALGWTFAIARRVMLDVRTERIRNTVPLDEASRDTSETSTREEAGRTVRDLLDQLEPKDRALLERRYLHEEDFEEIARREGMTAVNVRQRISRALRKLRIELLPL